VAWLIREAGRPGGPPKGSSVVVNMSGRGDKDAEQVMHLLGKDGAVGSGAARALNRDLDSM
jgi:tryptophan synthase beta subunit